MNSSRDIDGGWAWIVMAASCMNLLVAPGLAFVGGIFQNLFLEQFHESVRLTSWVTALFGSLMQLAGPLASVLAHYASCRVSVMTGAVLLSVGLVISSFTSSLPVLFVSFGILSGLGLGLIYTPSIVVVNFFFKKKRSFVNGISLSASGVGILLFPLLCRHLLDVFLWRQSMLILAAISAQMIPLGALMFPVHEKTNKSCISFREHQTKDDTRKDLDATKPMITENITQNTRSKGNKTKQYTIIKNSAFLLLCFMLLLWNAGTAILLIHFPSFCKEHGTSKNEISYIMASNGPALIFSRVMIGALGSDEKVDKLAVFIGLLLISGTYFCLTPLFATTVPAQITLMILAGVFNGGTYSLLATFTIDTVGLQFLNVAFGLEMVFAGVGFLIGPPMAGWMVDSLGSYNKSMFLAGIFIYLSAVFLMLIPVVHKHREIDTTEEVKENNVTQ